MKHMCTHKLTHNILQSIFPVHQDTKFHFFWSISVSVFFSTCQTCLSSKVKSKLSHSGRNNNKTSALHYKLTVCFGYALQSTDTAVLCKPIAHWPAHLKLSWDELETFSPSIQDTRGLHHSPIKTTTTKSTCWHFYLPIVNLCLIK